MEGYNAVDHTVLEFPPVDNDFPPGADFERYFSYFSPTATVADRTQIKAWKAREVDLRSSGGHEAAFPGRRIHPLNFLLKHYPIRSQAHGERKVLSARKPRITPEERRLGWHTQYDHVRPGHVFVRDLRELLPADKDFTERWLLERLYDFPLSVADPLPREIRRAMSTALRKAGLLEPARTVRRMYRVSRGRHPDTGRR
jgi:hypothetical protein